MHRTMRKNGFPACTSGLASCAAFLGAVAAASAQSSINPPKDPNQVEVFLVRQDFSDCTNSNVPNTSSPLDAGTVVVTRMPDGNTTVKVAMTTKPDTTYHFYLKCVRELGTLTTGDEGTATASFSFPTSSVENVFAFDMYPEGAPSGDKYQSAQVAFK